MGDNAYTSTIHDVCSTSMGVVITEQRKLGWSELEDAVDATPGIDPWCSGPDWTMPVADAFGMGASQTVIESPGGYALLARYASNEGPDIIAGSEPLWGFACPIIGRNPSSVAGHVARWLSLESDWGRLLLPGLPSDGMLISILADQLQSLGEVRVSEGITRQIANLDTTADQWLARRSSSFRRNLRNAQRRSDEAGITITQVTDHVGLLERFLAIEKRSWKGQAGGGITSPEMLDFYSQVIGRLIRRGRLRAAVAQLDGRDVGFVFGGVRSGRYRGLQLSYIEEAAAFSVSHLLQFHQIKALAAEGVHTYDMGMDMEYKRRWADHAETSIVLVLDRH